MKVLVAQQSAPPRTGDDVWSALPSEVVVAPFVCADRSCVCERVHQGVISHGFTTSMVVSDIDITAEALIAACRIHLDASQWTAVVEDSAELDIVAADLIDAMCETAQRHEVGTVLRVTHEHSRGLWTYDTVSNRPPAIDDSPTPRTRDDGQ